MKDTNGRTRYYTYRIRLEKLKRSTVLLLVIARVLLLLVALIHLYR